MSPIGGQLSDPANPLSNILEPQPALSPDLTLQGVVRGTRPLTGFDGTGSLGVPGGGTTAPAGLPAAVGSALPAGTGLASGAPLGAAAPMSPPGDFAPPVPWNVLFDPVDHDPFGVAAGAVDGGLYG